MSVLELLLPTSLETPLVMGAIETGWVLVSAAWVLRERRPPISTLAWILALSFLPVIGFAIYFVFGPRRFDRKKRRLGRIRARRSEYVGRFGPLSGEARTPAEQLTLMALRLGAQPPETARAIELFVEGDAFYAAVEAAVAAARHHVHAEYYVFDPDRTGTRIRDALAAAAARGIRVRLLVDAAGSSRAGDRFFAPLVAAGGEVQRFNAIAFARVRENSFNFRTHRKILVCDGRVGFTGGMNVADDHSAAASGERAWLDASIRVEGAAVHGLQLAFIENWDFATRSRENLGATEAYFPAEAPGPDLVQVVASGPDEDPPALSILYPAAFAQARERLWIATPYFVPDEASANALHAAALRGVDVRLLLPGKSDNRLVDAASRTWHAPLARDGVQIAFHDRSMMHAKTCVVDEALGIVGTANLDSRSLRLNFEVTALLHGGPPVAALAGWYAGAFERARKWHAHRDGREGFGRRIAGSVARLFSPQL